MAAKLRRMSAAPLWNTPAGRLAVLSLAVVGLHLRAGKLLGQKQGISELPSAAESKGDVKFFYSVNNVYKKASSGVFSAKLKPTTRQKSIQVCESTHS